MACGSDDRRTCLARSSRDEIQILAECGGATSLSSVRHNWNRYGDGNAVLIDSIM
jgi:hypothetical protein